MPLFKAFVWGKSL